MADKVAQIIGRIFAVDETTITDDSSPETIDAWDSVEHLALLGEIEKAYHIRFTISDIVTLYRVKDIRACLKKYGVKG